MYMIQYTETDRRLGHDSFLQKIIFDSFFSFQFQ